jgi:hypothetical protein
MFPQQYMQNRFAFRWYGQVNEEDFIEPSSPQEFWRQQANVVGGHNYENRPGIQRKMLLPARKLKLQAEFALRIQAKFHFPFYFFKAQFEIWQEFTACQPCKKL